MNLSELAEYRQILMRTLGSNQRIKDYLTNTTGSATSLDKIINKYIFPYQYIPGTVTNKMTYIAMDIAVRHVYDRTIKSLGITLYVFCDDSISGCVNPDTGKMCLRYDLLANEIDKLLNGNTSLGFRADLVSVQPYFPKDSYHGLMLKYETNDLNWKV